jgi:hypothetical protein
MALYDVPVDRRFAVLTHTQHPLYSPNAFKQVGNTTLPANPISANRVAPSAIYNPKLSGVGEAGYGRPFPYRGLSYPGAGSPRSSILRGIAYAGAGSPRTSVKGLAYPGAGSPSASVYRPGLSYAGAGSPRKSVLRDAYINDNPPAGTLRTIPLKGLRDDTPTPVDTGTTLGPSLPSSTPPTGDSVWSSITGAFGSLFTTTVSAGTVAADTSIIGAIAGTGGKSPQSSTTVVAKPATTTALFGIPTATLTMIALGAVAYFAVKK